MSIVSCIAASALYIIMFMSFSSKAYQNFAKLGVTYLILLLMNVFVPVSSAFNAVVYFMTIVLIYLFIFRESIYSSSINTFLMFLIHYSSAMLSTNVYLLLNGELVDYRNAFATTRIGYLLILIAIAATLVFATRSALIALKKHFHVLKDRQFQLYATNLLIIILFFVYMRFNIKNSVKIVYTNDFLLNSYMALHLLVSFVLLVWLTLITNQFTINSTIRSRKAGATFQDIVKKAKKDNEALSVVYINFPTFHDVVSMYGKKEGENLLRMASNVVRSVAPEGLMMPLKAGESLIILEKCDEPQAGLIVGDIEHRLKETLYKNMSGVPFVTGLSQYNSLVHDDYKSLILSAKENTRRR